MQERPHLAGVARNAEKAVARRVKSKVGLKVELKVERKSGGHDFSRAALRSSARGFSP
jgi:hypothetical protein